MTSSSWDRSRRVAAASSVLMVIAVAAGLVVLALGVSMPEAWWPRTGQAFATDVHSPHKTPCDLIAGPGKAYCERGSTTAAFAEGPRGAGAAWQLVPPAVGVAALVLWRRRDTAVHRRR
ncbi:hypothetical protein H1V43_33810 [Streptomyces sp. PSKA54]|uniref:Uncharacterized protein n=1 Tax=Streptomyces himalayensis subsp. aureolus TaxID=2758039 RepID=A0A7W2D7I9_9ACTN|nr:hypothetical protein [Streptomyces himalayensis]MBA4866211.1 hypothetical protein [Streptomyces himalayensis subsp. aureolus]